MSRWLLLALLLSALLFSGCAETRLYESGHLIAVVQGDATQLTITTKTTSFHVDALSHSAPTTAAYTGATSAVGAIGTAVVSGIIAKP